MIKLYLSILVCLLCNSEIFSQENFYSSIAIPTELKKDANAVVRLNEVNIKLLSTNKILVSVKRIVSVLNKQGNSSIDAYVHYDNDLRIQKLEAFVFDEFGNEIKKIKKKEFKDVSAVDGGTLYSDSRVKYLEYTPIEYPYTVEFFYETITENTAFIPSFYPLNAYYLSVEKATYTLVNPTSIPIRNKEINFEAFSVKKNNVDYNFSTRQIT